ncbi:hypothetical protein ACC771_06210, partial [Rhizobium ruizarguesonis]
WTMEYRIRHAMGHLIWVTETGGGIWDEKGELLYLEGSIINIESLYQRIDDQTADMRITASKTNEILQSLRYLKLLAVNAGIEAMVPVLAAELKPLRVNGVSPGVVDTPWWNFLPPEQRGSTFADFAGRTPVGRVG